MTREDYRNAVCLEGEKMCGQNSELKLASTVGGNKKGFLKYVNTKKGTTSNIGLLFTSQIGSQTKQTFNVFFASVFNTEHGPWDTWSPVLKSITHRIIES